MSPSRPATQAGRFYTARPDQLREQVSGYIANARTQSVEPPARGFVSPHAGLLYSGATAGHTYRQLRELAPETVFVFAPTHSERFPLASIWDGPAYTTPLGEYPIDADIAARLRRILPHMGCNVSAESREHSLEVQVPFLQIACPRAKMIPLLIGDPEPGNVGRLVQAVIQLLDDTEGLAERAAFVASSDAYHGHSLKECRAQDNRLAQAVESMDVSRFYEEIWNRETMACGYGAIAAVMGISKHLGARRGIVLHRSTSADAVPSASGDYVVGYLSAMFG